MPSALRRIVLSISLLTAVAASSLSSASTANTTVLSLSPQDVAALNVLKRGDGSLVIAADGSKRHSEWRFHAIALQAGSQPLADDPNGNLAKRRFLISERGPQQIALAFEADGRFAFGFLDDANGLQRLVPAKTQAAGLNLLAEAVKEQPVNCEADSIAPSPFQPLRLKSPGTVPTAAKGGVSGYQAKVAIEVDYPMMSGHFGNSPATALAWLQELFLATNLFYQRDLALQLVMATPVVYNTSTDPYCTSGCSPLGAHLMFQFGDYWRDNRSGIDRDFAALISGRLTGGNPTGVSWIDVYCDTGHDELTAFGTQTAGSYGVNLYVAGNGVSGGTAAELFGHELGHQLGAAHNNCTDTDTGTTGLQPIDMCRTGGTPPPGGSCWSGALSCPTGGAGKMMSSGCADLAGCALNRQREFHPVQIGLLTTNISDATPSCLSTTTLPNPDILYYDGFE